MWMQKGVSKNYSSVTVKRHLLELLIKYRIQTPGSLLRWRGGGSTGRPQLVAKELLPLSFHRHQPTTASKAAEEHGGGSFFEDLMETGEV